MSRIVHFAMVGDLEVLLVVVRLARWLLYKNKRPSLEGLSLLGRSVEARVLISGDISR